VDATSVKHKNGMSRNKERKFVAKSCLCYLQRAVLVAGFTFVFYWTIVRANIPVNGKLSLTILSKSYIS